jgi:hypothetical protein
MTARARIRCCMHHSSADPCCRVLPMLTQIGRPLQGPAVPMVRRHLNASAARFGPQVQTVSGNYVAAKRKGVVNGVDLGYTGMVSRCCGSVVLMDVKKWLTGVDLYRSNAEGRYVALRYIVLLQVRSIEVDSVNRQLDAGYMVLLSNLGYSASGAPAARLLASASVHVQISLGIHKQTTNPEHSCPRRSLQ